MAPSCNKKSWCGLVGALPDMFHSRRALRHTLSGPSCSIYHDCVKLSSIFLVVLIFNSKRIAGVREQRWSKTKAKDVVATKSAIEAGVKIVPEVELKASVEAAVRTCAAETTKAATRHAQQRRW